MAMDGEFLLRSDDYLVYILFKHVDNLVENYQVEFVLTLSVKVEQTFGRCVCVCVFYVILFHFAGYSW